MRVRYERLGSGALVTLDWPERANALSEEMASLLAETVDRAVADNVRALAITGEGAAFCSGGQLDDPLPEDAGAILETAINPLLLTLGALGIPIITALNGPAVGAGASLALAGDIVIAASTAWLSFGFAQIGLSPDAGASWLLPRALPWQRTMSLMMLGERVSAAQAAEWGLVTRVVERDELDTETKAMLARLAAGPTKSYAATRRLARAGLETSFADALLAERDAQRASGRTQDFREGVSAFRKRRAPMFLGR